MDVIAKENSTGKVYVSGFDRQGRPILVMRPRKENTHDHDGNIKHTVYQVRLCSLHPIHSLPALNPAADTEMLSILPLPLLLLPNTSYCLTAIAAAADHPVFYHACTGAVAAAAAAASVTFCAGSDGKS